VDGLTEGPTEGEHVVGDNDEGDNEGSTVEGVSVGVKVGETEGVKDGEAVLGESDGISVGIVGENDTTGAAVLGVSEGQCVLGAFVGANEEGELEVGERVEGETVGLNVGTAHC